MPAGTVPPPLRPHLAAISGYEDRPAPGTVHHGLPSPTLTVVIAFDEPLDCGWVTEPDGCRRRWVTVAGLHTRPALIRTHGHQHGIQLALTPYGARALFGVPAGALASEVVAYEELGRGASAELTALAAAPGWPDRFAALARVLGTQVARNGGGEPPAPEVAEAWRLLQRTDGRIRIAEVADRLGWGRRRLTARFTAEYGIGPKQAARLFRFDRSVQLLRRGTTLAETADRCGYADQAHLSREWTDLAGRTPRQARDEPYFTPISSRQPAGRGATVGR